MELSLIIKEIRKYVSLSQEDFATAIGLSRSNLSQIEIGRNTPSVEMLNQIAKIFHINISVVFEMVNSDKKLLPELLPKLLLCDNIDKNLSPINDKVDEKKYTPKYIPNYTPSSENLDKNGYLDGYPNDNLRKKNAQATEKKCIPECIPSSDISLRDNQDVSVATHVKRGGIPLLPIDAAAGLLSGSGVQVMEYECEQYVIPSFKDADFMIRVNGDSMEPKFYSGDIVACQRLPLDTFFQWNRVYVVDTEQGVLVKRIKQGSDKQHIKLVSENAEYEPFELHLSQLNGLGRVIGHVRLE